MRNLRRFGACLALALLALYSGCSDQGPADPEIDRDIAPPSRAISDAVHDDGNEHFFWLAPMVGTPEGFAGPFDGTLAPRVEICDFDGVSCTAVIASYTTTSGEGSETVRVVADDEHYIVNWHTDEFDVVPGPTYRIGVLIASTELGYADVQMGSTGKEVRNLTTDEIIGLKDGRTLPIKFRIEEGAVFAVDGDGGSFTTDDGRAALVVPAGSLTELVGITIEPWEGAYPQGQSMIPNTLFDFQPDGTAFSPPAQVTIAYDEADLGALPESALTVLTLVDGEWIEAEGSTVDEAANTVSGLIYGFSPKGAGGKVTSVDVTPASATLEIGETVQLTGDPKNAAGESVNRKLTWKSGDDAIATVDNNGLVTAAAEGTVTIEGRSGGATGTSEVTVNPIDPCANIVITFEDANLEAAVRELEEIPDEGPITGELAATVTSIVSFSGGIASLEGLQCFTGLESLHVFNSEITDLNPIAGLTSLVILAIPDSSIEDLSPLTGLTGLQSLDLPRNPVADLAPLEGLVALRSLALQGTQVDGDDLSVVGSLVDLRVLVLDDLGLTNLDFLEGNTSLTYLSAAENPVVDISALDGHPTLERLTMGGGDIGGSEATLGSLAALTTLVLPGMGVSDLGFLSSLNQLEYLNLSDNPFSDLAPLATLGSLNGLYLGDNSQLGSMDLSPLGTLNALESLYLSRSAISDVSFVSTLPSLRILLMATNLIEDASPILDVATLESLNLRENPITCDDPFFDALAPTVDVTCNNAPIAYLSAPVDGEVFEEGETVAFSGAGSDPPNGTSGVALLTWSSDIDGVLGTGGTLSTTLTAGEHVITLTATDTHGGMGSASVGITVNPAPPPANLLVGDILASMLDEQEFQSRYGSDWVLADGRSLTGSDYTGLTGYGSLDLRGMFLRGFEAGLPVGATEADNVGPHTHPFNVQPFGNNYVGGGINGHGWRPASYNPFPKPEIDLQILPAGGTETRPNNVAVYFYLRVDDEEPDLTIHELGVGDIVPSLLDEWSFQAAHGPEWVLADGRSAAGSDFAAVTGLGSVPDLRAMFLRGVNGGRAGEYGDPLEDMFDSNGTALADGTPRPVGSLQTDAFGSHSHEWNEPPLGNNYVGGGINGHGWRPSTYNPFPKPEIDLEILGDGSAETRPENVAVYYYIRLDEGSQATLRHQVAVGDVVPSMVDEASFLAQHGPGWVLADGRNVAGSPYEAATGFSNVPDLRGKFLRGVSGARALHADPADAVIPLDGTPPADGLPRPVGSTQAASVESHTHGFNVQPLGNNYVGGGINGHGWRPASYNPFPKPEIDLAILPGTGETVPNNVHVYFYIRIGQ